MTGENVEIKESSIGGVIGDERDKQRLKRKFVAFAAEQDDLMASYWTLQEEAVAAGVQLDISPSLQSNQSSLFEPPVKKQKYFINTSEKWTQTSYSDVR